jgi:hypothetical protein
MDGEERHDAQASSGAGDAREESSRVPITEQIIRIYATEPVAELTMKIYSNRPGAEDMVRSVLTESISEASRAGAAARGAEEPVAVSAPPEAPVPAPAPPATGQSPGQHQSEPAAWGSSSVPAAGGIVAPPGPEMTRPDAIGAAPADSHAFGPTPSYRHTTPVEMLSGAPAQPGSGASPDGPPRQGSSADVGREQQTPASPETVAERVDAGSAEPAPAEPDGPSLSERVAQVFGRHPGEPSSEDSGQ